jgi:hypothetical protein
MAAITQIKAVIYTADSSSANTDGGVFLGICGREFRLGKAGVDDFDRASHREYLLGAGSNIERATDNDPRSPQLDTIETDRFPAYIRFEPDVATGDWDFDGAEVTISPGGAKFARLGVGSDRIHLKMGENMGKFCYLAKV